MKNLFLLFFILFSIINSQNLNILVDEDYNDWNEITPSYTDSENDQLSGNIDFGRLWIENNDDYLFLRIEAGGKINLQNDNRITLYIDTDNNSSTGKSVSNIGAELEYTFGQRGGYVRLGSNTYAVQHHDIGLISAPTVTSREFEIAVSLNSKINGNDLFQSENINILFADNSVGKDQIPNSGEFINYQIQTNVPHELPSISIKKGNSNFLRVLSYNVLRDNLFKTSLFDEYSRIFNAIKPDIIAFQEIYNNNSQAAADLIETMLPSEEGESWFHSKAEDTNPSNSYNTDLIIVSRYRILNSYRIEGFYIDGSVEDRANFAVLIDLRPKYNTDLLVINAHPPCCSADERRQEEVDKIMAFIREARLEGGILTLTENTPILIMGDMNFVGLDGQRNTLLTGDISDNSAYGPDFNPDWNGSSFKDAKPYTTNLPAAFTWYNEGESYPPGRLDYIIYSSSVLELKNSYSLFTPAMHPDTLLKYNLQNSDAVTASDHLPVVADFEFYPLTSVKDRTGNNIPEEFKLFQNYPNPFNPATKIQYSIPVAVPSEVEGPQVKLSVYDILGREVATLVRNKQSPGNYEVEFNGSNFSNGIYYYQLSYGELTQTRKMIILK